MLFDDNGISIDGALSLSDSVDQLKRFEAAGWAASRVDGHDAAAIAAALEKAQNSDKPVLIACKTQIATARRPRPQGVRARSPLGADEIKARAATLEVEHEPFHVPTTNSPPGAPPASARKARMPTGTSGSPRSRPASAPSSSAACAATCRRRSTTRARGERVACRTPKDIATRSSSEFALESLVPAVPEMIGGSADLTAPTTRAPRR